MKRAGSAGTTLRSFSPEPIATCGNQGIHRVAQLAEPRHVVQSCNSAQHWSDGKCLHRCFEATKNAAVGTNQVHRLHTGFMGDSRELVEQARFLKALYLYRSFWNQRKQVLRLARAEGAMAVEQQNVLPRLSRSINPGDWLHGHRHAIFSFCGHGVLAIRNSPSREPLKANAVNAWRSLSALASAKLSNVSCVFPGLIAELLVHAH